MAVEVVVLVVGVVVSTIIVYMLGVLGTKEISFEDAVAKERQRQREETGSKGKKNKGSGAKKLRSGGGRARLPSDGVGGVAAAASSDDHESPGATTEDDANDDDQLLRDEQREKVATEKELKAKEKAEKELKQKEKLEKEQKLKEKAEKEQKQKLEKEQKQKLEKEQKQKLEKAEKEQKQKEQKQRELEKQKQKDLEQQKQLEIQKQLLDQQKELELEQGLERQQEAVKQAQQQQIVDQESKRTDKKKKQLKQDEVQQQQKQKQPKQQKSSTSNGVAAENSFESNSASELSAEKPTKNNHNNIKKQQQLEKAVSEESNSYANGNKKAGGGNNKKTVEKEETGGSISPAPGDDEGQINGTNNLAKKNKKNSQKSDKDQVSTIIKTVEKAGLSSNQLQSVVDSLLAMATDGGWSEARKGTDTGLVKKLEEANIAIDQHKEAHSGMTIKISELRGELNTERSKVTQLRKQLEQSAVEQQKLLDRDVQLQQQHKQQLQQAVQQQALQQIQEERTRLQHECEEKIRQVEAASVEAARVAGEEATAIVQQQALQHVQELQHELAGAKQQFQQAQFTTDSVSRDKTDVEGRLLAAQQEIAHVITTTEANDRLVHQLRQELENMQALASEAVRPASDGQENNADAVAAQEQQLAEKQADLEKQVEQVALLNKEVNRLKSELQTYSSKNDELRRKNTSVLEALQTMEVRLQQSDQKSTANLQSCEEGYRQLLKRLYPSITSDASLDSAAFQQQFEAAAKQHQQEIESNRQVEVVEVVVHKEVQDPALQQRLDQIEILNKELLSKTISLEQSLSDAQRLASAAVKEREAAQQQNHQLQQQLQQVKQEAAAAKAAPAPAPDTDRLDQLLEENKQLQEKVLHYQTVLDNTESLLQTLQSSVEGEETKWVAVVKEREDRLDQLNKENEDLQQQLQQQKEQDDKTKLQADLDVVKKEKTDLEQKLCRLQAEKGAEVAELRELIAVGQETSKDQEQLIAQLQQELQQDKSASSTTNGPPATSDDPVDEESGGVKQ